MNNYKKVFLAVLCFQGVSCAGPGTYQVLAQVISNELPGRDYEPISEDYYKSEDYSFLILKIGKRDPIKLVLSSIDKGIFQWVTADKRFLYTNEHGRIIRISGFENDLSISGLQAINNPKDMIYSYYFDFYEPKLSKVRAIDNLISEEKVAHEFFHEVYIDVIQETYITSVPMIKWEFENTYLYFEGTPIQSVQTVHPFLPKYRLYFFYK